MSNAFKPHADATATLGTIHSQDEKRDAVHLAVYQVELGMDVKPSSPLIIIDGKAYLAEKNESAIGIADPFIKTKGKIKEGSKIWLVLYPGMISSLRHVWEHPEFKSSESDSASQNQQIIDNDKSQAFQVSYEYLSDFADDIGITTANLIECAQDYLATGQYHNGGAECEGEWICDEFWNHYEVVTKTEVVQHNRGNFISCSC